MQSSDEPCEKPPATPADLVNTIMAELRHAKDTDISLLDILSKNVIRITPSNTAVADALKDIEKLALNRAEEAANDHTDHH